MRTGRPRDFDIDQALLTAMRLFREKGFEGTSLSDLTQAMGINRPSLYAAFGNKEALFRKALDRYAEESCYIKTALEAPKIRDALKRFLLGAAEALTHPKEPQGCLTINGGLACGEEADTVRQELVRRRAMVETALKQRLDRAKKEGDSAKDAPSGDIARFVATVMQGMAVQAAGGATRKELVRTAEMTISALLHIL